MGKFGYGLLGVLAVGLVAGAAWLVFRDVRETALREPPEPHAERLARTALDALTPENGWLPALRQPLFAWDEDGEGWVREEEAGIALAESLPPSVPSHPGGNDPEPKPGDEEPPLMPVPRETDTNTGATSLEIADAPQGGSSGRSLAVPVRFPDPCTILRRPPGMTGIRYIAYDVYVPAEVQGYAGCLFFMKDKDGRWFQARSRTALMPGRWTTVTADLRGGSPDVEPLGHLGAWEENQASQVRTIGLTFYGDKPFEGRVYLDNFRGWMRPDRFANSLQRLELNNPTEAERARLEELNALMERVPDDTEPLVFLNVRADPLPPPADAAGETSLPSVGLYQTFTARFELNRRVYNPFDPEMADIQAEVTAPSGKKNRVLGFWYQDFAAEPSYAEERLEPLGRPEWRVRFAPTELGIHHVAIRATLFPGQPNAQQADGPVLQFVATPSGERGFVRPSKKDPRWFEFDDGTFFYPLGHNVHSPVDLRCWEAVFHEPPPLSRGLNLYKDFFPKMQAAGENVGEVWMSSWWLGIEWTRRWRGYHGPGRYSLEHAWKLDRVLELARQHGIRVHLVLDNHGKLSEWCDWEWPTNPFNRTTEPGGLVDRPSEYFTNAACRQMHKRRMRYIAARWGSDSTVMGWELMSEMDLVGDGSSTSRGPIGRAVDGNLHRHPTTQAWITEMMQALKEYDPYGRPVTTHYARNFNGVDKQLAGTPLFDYIVCVGYRPTPGFANLALQTSENLTPHGKPFWVTEFGGEWNATSMPRLEADLHCGLWSSWMTNAAGSPLFWWYDFIDKKGLYDHYKAFSKYVQGEDRRGLETQTERVTFTRRSGGLAGLQCRWKEGAYVWIYDEAAMNELPPRENLARYENVGAKLMGLAPGKYRLEFWDTWSGNVLDMKQVEVGPGQPLEIDLPIFRGDLALKVKPASAGDDVRVSFPELFEKVETSAPAVKPPPAPSR